MADQSKEEHLLSVSIYRVTYEGVSGISCAISAARNPSPEEWIAALCSVAEGLHSSTGINPAEALEQMWQRAQGVGAPSVGERLAAAEEEVLRLRLKYEPIDLSEVCP